MSKLNALSGQIRSRLTALRALPGAQEGNDPSKRPSIRQVALSTMMPLCLFALALNLLIEILAHRSLFGALEAIFSGPLLFLTGTLILLFTLSIASLFKHRTFVALCIALVWLGLGVANCVLMIIRNSPLCGVDFYILSTGFSIITVYLSVFQIILIAAAIILAIVGMVVVYKKLPKRPIPFRSGLFQLILSAVSLFGMLFAIGQAGLVPEQFDDMTEAYGRYGFAYCFTQTVFDRGIEMPEDYSKDSVEAILAILDEKSPVSVPENERPNVIIVQLESFFDMTALQDITLTEDPIPYFRSLKAIQPYGFLSVPSVGGGTANTEFEVLTGMDLEFFGIGEYPYNTILTERPLSSMAHTMKSLGYSAHVYHNHEGSFYDRNLVYPNLGFDSFTSIEYMNDYETNLLTWCDDSILTSELISTLTSTEEKDFLFAVSVQLHGKYPTEYESPENGIRIGGITDPALSAQYHYYADQLREVDNFVRELTAALSAYPEPVTLVLYGDHLPSLNITQDQLPAEQTLYQTEYVIWSNQTALPHVREDLTCAQLSAYALSYCGIYEGSLNRLHQTMRDRDCYKTWLHTLQYDMVHGSAVSLHSPCEPSEMQMGRNPITITDTLGSDQGLYIYGTNFTAHSTISINGWNTETIFLSPTQLLAPNGMAHLGDKITVVQISGSGAELSETESFTVTKLNRSTN